MNFDTSTLVKFLPLVLLIVVFYFLMLRPQKKQQKARDEMMNNMKVGDEVMTAGGFYGIIYAIDEENAVLEMLPDDNKLMVRRASIVKVITAEDAQPDVEEVDEVEEVEEVEEVAEVVAPEETESAEEVPAQEA